jgi:hypothetical protein
LEHFSELSSRIDDVLAKGEAPLSDPAKLALARVKARGMSSGAKATSQDTIENLQ